MITRRSLLGSITAASLFPSLPKDERSFLVLGLLHPKQLLVRPAGTARLHCQSQEKSWTVEGAQVLALSIDSEQHRISGPGGTAVEFVLEVPGVIRRLYRGMLQVGGDGECVRPIVRMDCETAVGSIVGAEMPVSGTAMAALAAQAVVSRSIWQASLGRHRHRDADFCDTTHCQFLRAPAASGGAVEKAVGETKGASLWQDGRYVYARYSGACGGRTEGGRCDGYAYAAVNCDACRAEGRARQGHGWGLCQWGTLSLAQRGWTWPAILNHYYPELTLGT